MTPRPEQVRETEYLRFVVEPKIEGNRTVTILVRNRKDDFLLGVIKWYGPWRQYTFYPTEQSALFNYKCLREIAEVCLARTMGQREQARLRRAKGAQL